MHRETCPFLVRSASAGRCRNPSYGSVIAYRICCSADLLAPPPENSLLLTSRPLSSRKDNAIRWHGSCCFTPGTEGKSKRGTVCGEGVMLSVHVDNVEDVAVVQVVGRIVHSAA